jgi:glucose/arabinose dehydrogenase
MRRTVSALFALFFLLSTGGACRSDSEQATETDSPSGDTTASVECTTPLETRPPNAPNQTPAFPAQTRACGLTSTVSFVVDVIASDLVHPWAVEPLPNGDFLLTERPGRMRVISSSGVVGPPITGLPDVDARGQGGLLDVALSPTFDADRMIYWSFTEPRQGGNATSVARGVLSDDGTRLSQVEVIFRSVPAYNGTAHFGSRLAFGPDGKLYITLGDRSVTPMRMQAQQMDSHLGKVIRINPDGSAPSDNPFVGQQGAKPEIWSMGHRNVQAAAFDPDGQLWIVEHGTQGGDELNLIEGGKNYGWPLQAYGEEYSGAPIAGSSTQVQGMEQPVYYWDPVIAPSGAQFYTGSMFPEWQGNLFIGSLKDHMLVRLTLKNNRVTGEERLLEDRGQRIRDVRQGPDGALYIVTDESNGRLWRLRAE